MELFFFAGEAALDAAAWKSWPEEQEGLKGGRYDEWRGSRVVAQQADTVDAPSPTESWARSNDHRW